MLKCIEQDDDKCMVIVERNISLPRYDIGSTVTFTTKEGTFQGKVTGISAQWDATGGVFDYEVFVPYPELGDYRNVYEENIINKQ
jgi:hypothetical protein